MLPNTGRWATIAPWTFRISSYIVYEKANGFECKLGVITAGERSLTRLTLICIHGADLSLGLRRRLDSWEIDVARQMADHESARLSGSRP
jgi:hypothetical protein